MQAIKHTNNYNAGMMDRVAIKSSLNKPNKGGRFSSSSLAHDPSNPHAQDAYSFSGHQKNSLQPFRRNEKHALNKSVSHSVTNQPQTYNASDFKFGLPPEMVYTQEDRNSKLQIQNFKVYRELRRKMEISIQRQRKALKQSINQYCAADND